ncbi:MAG TPA: NifU family protein [Candidatus Omnitrophota bacterium]|nr:NifU family protein [Candidatus Omnitrophota bacterium]
MEEKVKTVIREKIRPILQRDGGDIEFLGVKDGMAQVRLRGACGCCPMSQMTLKAVAERIVKEDVPGIKGVETVS